MQASAARAAEDAVRQAAQARPRSGAATTLHRADGRCSQAREEEGTLAPPPSPTGPSPAGEAREVPPQPAAREAATPESLDYEKDRQAEASRVRARRHGAARCMALTLAPRAQDWRHSFGEQQRHGLPTQTQHTGLQREYGRD